MAEQSPVENSHVSDFIRKRRKKSLQADGSDAQKRRRSLPPKRGIIKRIDKNAIENQPAGRTTRRPTSSGPVRQPISIKKPSVDSMPQRKAPQARPTPRAPSDFMDPAMERMHLEEKAAKRRVVEEENKKKELEAKQLPTSERDARRLIEREKRVKAREEAKEKAEEIRLQRKKESDLKRQEDERRRKEQEVEMKQLEEKRLQKEREEEQKRLEIEKERQEKEKTRIYNKIESCKGELTEEEKKLAIKIANEMVKRNIEWKGYISLHSGIGGAMLR